MSYHHPFGIAKSLHNPEYVEFLFVILMLYFAWRFYVYRKLENDKYLHDINDSLNKNLKFINIAKETFAIHPNNGNIRIGFNDNTYVFLDVCSINCELRIRSYNMIRGNGDEPITLDFEKQIEQHGGQALEMSVPLSRILPSLPRSFWDSAVNYPGFSDFILPWILFIVALLCFIIKMMN